MDELNLLADADTRGRRYTEGNATRRVFPSAEAIAALAAFDEQLPAQGRPAEDTLALLDRAGSSATTASNGPRYFGFVIGAALPAAAAAERMMLAWDQCASTFDNSPVAAARRTLLARQGWDFDQQGLIGAPEIKVIISELAHITVKKALRVLGFGLGRLIEAPVDAHGRVDPAHLPPLDERTILCLQAGEVNTGEFDPFAQIMPLARAANAWVHVDGAFGLWARASSLAGLADGVEQADSWTTDAHKWLNTPYDCAMTICRDAQALAAAMNCDAVYSTASADAQKNLTLEFSRRARGIPVWAALRTLGRGGVGALVERHHTQAQRIGEALAAAKFEVLNRVALNQVLFRCATDDETHALRIAVQASGEAWFGATIWQGRPALRISVSSWRTRDEDVEALLQLLLRLGPSACG